MEIILNRKPITVNEKNFNAVPDVKGNNTVMFLAELPKNALVTSVILNGKHLKTANNPADEVTVEYPRDEYHEGKRIVAVLRSVYDGNKIVEAARAFEIKGFEVEFIKTAIAEV